VSAGVTAALGNDGGDVPAALVAVTVKVSAVPLVRPDTGELIPVVVVAVQDTHAGDGTIV